MTQIPFVPEPLAKRLKDSGIMVGECSNCKETCLALTNAGQMVCPHCTAPAKWVWHVVSVAFTPEES